MNRTTALFIALFAACGSTSSGNGRDSGSQSGTDAAAAADSGNQGHPDATNNDGGVVEQDANVAIMDASQNPADAATPNDSGVVVTPDGGTPADGGTAADGGAAVDGGLICVPPAGYMGNSKNVGAACSPGGGECRSHTFANLCSIDLDPMGDNFCIHIGCRDHATCGEDACCTGRAGSAIHACVPKGCLVTDPAMDCPPIP